jgi:hypothetical protein
VSRETTRENRLERMAERRGLRITKSRRRDPSEFDYGRYMLRDVNIRVIVAGTTTAGRALWTLEDVKTYDLKPPLKDEEPVGRKAPRPSDCARHPCPH